MDGMMVATHQIEVGGPDREYTGSHTLNLPSPTAVIAELSVTSFSYLYSGNNMTAAGYFTACTTDGSNPPFPPNETFGFFGSISGQPRQVVIRNGLTSITYEVDVQNCEAEFTFNLFFWPGVNRGSF